MERRKIFIVDDHPGREAERQRPGQHGDGPGAISHQRPGAGEVVAPELTVGEGFSLPRDLERL